MYLLGKQSNILRKPVKKVDSYMRVGSIGACANPLTGFTQLLDMIQHRGASRGVFVSAC